MSDERIPTYGALTSTHTMSDDTAAKLMKARHDSDLAYQSLFDDISQQDDATSQAELQASHQLLIKARKQADELLKKALAERDSNEVDAVVETMIGVTDGLTHSLIRYSLFSEQSNSVVSNALIVARLTSDLREAAEHLGSTIASVVNTPPPLSRRDLKAIYETRGTINYTYYLTKRRIFAFDGDDTMLPAFKSLQVDFYENGLNFAEGIINQGLYKNKYDVTSAQFVEHYMPTLDSILKVRDEALVYALSKAEAQKQETKDALLLVACSALFLLSAFAYLTTLLKGKIINPVINATNTILRLVDKPQTHHLNTASQTGEIIAMQAAIVSLEQSMIEKKQLESERQDLMVQLEQQANTDPLTQLCNRRSFYSMGEREFNLTQRRVNALSVAMVDVDHFKSINDRYGHPVGDQVLIELSWLFSKNCRDGDVLGRIGGEEFAFVYVDCNENQAWEAAERLRKEVERLSIEIADIAPLKVTISIGLATLSSYHSSFESMIQEADQAMYRAKASGRNRVETSAILAS